jgi:DNA invertase Pin-like site-specific DNA recombinase
MAVSGRQEGWPQVQALMQAARHHECAYVLGRKCDRLARSVSHGLCALEACHHLGVRFMSVQEQVDTASPMGKAMFTSARAMAEWESSLIAERVKADMATAMARGKRLRRPATPAHLVSPIEALAGTTDMSMRPIQEAFVGQVSCAVVGHIVKRLREQSHAASL